MIQRLVLVMGVVAISGCGLFGGGKKEVNHMNDNKTVGGGIAIDIVDNVNSELWRLHPALNFLKSEIGAMALAQGVYAGGDSTMKADAATFWQEIEAEYMAYEPSKQIVLAIDSVIRSKYEAVAQRPSRIELLMLGGNWCSDTRMGLPIMCKVLDVLMSGSEGNLVRSREELEFAGVLIRLDYRRVNRDKKLIDGALDGSLFFGQKTITIGRVPEVCVAHTLNPTSVVGGNPSVDFASETVYVGSIVETPQTSWEADLLALLKK